MRFDVLTLFPAMFEGPLGESVLGRARERGLIAVHVHNIRDWAAGRHATTDDYPYGGGAGMVMKPEPLFAAVEAVLALADGAVTGREGAEAERAARVILMTPQGRVFNQALARELAGCARLVLICGRYEGVDERVREHLVTDEISIGDYVLTGGELPAMVVIDAVARLVPGVLGDAESSVDESHSAGLLEYPHYTRPAVFRGWAVPDVLLSGNHGEIARWRRRQALARTLARRPDLLPTAPLTPEDHTVLAELGWPHAQPPPPKPKRRRVRADAAPAPGGSAGSAATPIESARPAATMAPPASTADSVGATNEPPAAHSVAAADEPLAADEVDRVEREPAG